MLFFSLWWKGAGRPPGRAADEGRRRLPATGWKRCAHFKPHTLTEAEEKIINLKDVNGVRALETVYDTITNKFVFTWRWTARTKS